MENILINFSKYVLIFLMLFDTLLCFSLNVTKSEKSAERKSVLQNILTMTIFVICSIIIIYKNQSVATFVFAALEFVYLIMLVMLYRIIYPSSSRVLVNNMALLLALGFIMVERLAPANALKQFLIVMAGSVFSFFVPAIMKKRRLIVKFKYFYAIIGIILLLFTYIVGNTTYGANLSINIGSFSLQPSEFVKLIYVVFLAIILSKSKDFKNIVISAVIAAVHILILVASTDLGAALILFIVYVAMLFVGTGKVCYFAGGLGAGSVAAVLAYNFFSHVKARVTAWLDPWSVINTSGYQVTQSLFAIGTGGLFGIGLYQGLPTSIPVVVKDFVFAAIAEEFGLIFAICVILVCFSNFIAIMRIGIRSRDMFYKLISIGFGIMYIFQCFLTIGGVTKFIPSTGVTLPFVSYGGSSILCSLIMFAMLQAVFILVKENEDEEESADERYSEIHEEKEKKEQA